MFDVTDGDAVEAAAAVVAAELAERGLRLGAVVQSAGVGGWADVEEWEADHWQDVFEVNVFGVAAVAAAFTP